MIVETPEGLHGQNRAACPLTAKGDIKILGDQGERSSSTLDTHMPPGQCRPQPGMVVRCLVVASTVDERGEVESDRSIPVHQSVLHVGGVGAVFHPDGLLEDFFADPKGPRGDRRVASERVEVPVEDTSTIDGLVEPRDEDGSLERRGERRDEKPVVTAGQRSGDRSGRVAANSVGDEPLHGSEPR